MAAPRWHPKWYNKAAFVWVDMERGVYDWGERKPPRNRDGSPRVVIRQVLIECGRSPGYGKHDWHRSDEFQELLEKERARRDSGITDVVARIEEKTGPLIEAREVMGEQVAAIFARTPDAEDPLSLSPHQYVTDALAWTRYIDEQMGRASSQREQGLEAVLGELSRERKVTSEMMRGAVDLLAEYRQMQDRRLQAAGFIEGELSDD